MTKNTKCAKQDTKIVSWQISSTQGPLFFSDQKSSQHTQAWRKVVRFSNRERWWIKQQPLPHPHPYFTHLPALYHLHSFVRIYMSIKSELYHIIVGNLWHCIQRNVILILLDGDNKCLTLSPCKSYGTARQILGLMHQICLAYKYGFFSCTPLPRPEGRRRCPGSTVPWP